MMQQPTMIYDTFNLILSTNILQVSLHDDILFRYM